MTSPVKSTLNPEAPAYVSLPQQQTQINISSPPPPPGIIFFSSPITSNYYHLYQPYPSYHHHQYYYYLSPPAAPPLSTPAPGTAFLLPPVAISAPTRPILQHSPNNVAAIPARDDVNSQDANVEKGYRSAARHHGSSSSTDHLHQEGGSSSSSRDGQGIGNGSHVLEQAGAINIPVENDGNKTSIIIKNIPNGCKRGLVMKFLDYHCKNENRKSRYDSAEERVILAYDFFYLPMDFRSGSNKGYAFVNFTDPRAVWKFTVAAQGKALDGYKSSKRCFIAYAILQGKEEFVTQFKDVHFECDSPRFLPVTFSPPRTGSRNVQQTTVGIWVRKRIRCSLEQNGTARLQGDH
ncbi:protein MEI2-like 1 [Tripterygium wilfordii]|uniref:protein MEI2-like 1 n=1 Tax=Tripterygium wilfordii TaxID=458696 RepID=UPI0018F7E8CD|nr:protein MEI2-like 1 [Tripterygium wilfordii]